MRLRLHFLSSRFFVSGEELSFILGACDSVVSGSTALHIMLPKASTSWSPSDLDVYIPLRRKFQLTRLSSSDIFSVMTFANKHNKIDVVISTSLCAVSPIFQGLTMINGTQLYNGSLCAVGMAALKKYKERSFKFITCPAAHRYAFACKSDNRSLTDGGCLWVDVNCVPRAGRRPHQIFEKLGIFNVNWALGGLLCGVPAAFVQPYTRVRSSRDLIVGPPKQWIIATNGKRGGRAYVPCCLRFGLCVDVSQ